MWSNGRQLCKQQQASADFILKYFLKNILSIFSGLQQKYILYWREATSLVTILGIKAGLNCDISCQPQCSLQRTDIMGQVIFVGKDDKCCCH